MSDLGRLPDHIRSKIATGCWAWTASKNPQGYGSVGVSRRTRQAHVVVYELLVGSVPEGLELDHLCRNKACVNPEHLEPVTHAENVRRAVLAKAPRTHCRHGHELTPENTYSYTYGGRVHRTCRQCQHSKGARYRAARRARGDIQNRQCEAITGARDNRRGERCSRPALIGGTLCHGHEPTHAALRSARAAKAIATIRAKKDAAS